MRSVRVSIFVAVGLVSASVVATVVGCNTDSDGFDFGGFGTSGGVISSSSSSSGSSNFTDDINQPCDNARVGESCPEDDPNYQCEQQTTTNPACNAVFYCDGDGRWAEQTPARGKLACAFVCPATYTESTPPGACVGESAVATICDYDEGTCGCAPVGGPIFPDSDDDDADAGDASTTDADIDAGAGSDAGSRTYEWKCTRPPPVDASCPATRPREGRRCVVPTECDYGSCLFQDGEKMECYDGFWGRVPGRSKTSCDR